MKIVVKKIEKSVKITVPAGTAHSDWFLCRKCGYETMMKTLTNHPLCPKCGSLMDRK